MTVPVKPYPAYKDSGVPWLGEVPAHWTQLPGRACYREKKVPNRGMQETTVLSLSYGQIVIKPVEKLHGLVPASFETYQLIDPDDIVVRPTDLQNDWNSLRFGLARHRGIITSAYMCLNTQEPVTHEYGHLLLHAYDLKKVFYGLGSGLRQNLDWRDFRYLPCLVPPPDEQRAIVCYLDHADRRIRRYIRAKQKLIALLNEQKQAIIHQAVTRGLNPDVQLKPSGVEWLGDVPEGWEVFQLRRVTVARCDGPFGSGLKSTHYTESGIRVIRLQNIGHAEFKDGDRAFISPEHYASLGDHDVLAGDLLIAGLGDERIPPGRACVAPEGIGSAMVKADCFRFRPNSSWVSSSFLAFHLTATAVPAAAVLSTGATRQRVNLQSTASRPVAFPSLTEQILIVEALRKVLEPLQVAQARLEREIALLREYRARLVADVVTGKLDVREVARGLPEELEEAEPPDEDQALLEGEEAEACEVGAVIEEADV